MSNIDTIVIGSGLSGLVAAATLSKNGKNVYVFEQHSVAGGYATAYKRNDMRFDVSLHLMGDMGEGGMVRKMLEEIGVVPDLKFYKVDRLYKSIFPDGSIIAYDHERYFEELSKLFPKETEGIKELFNVFCNIREDILFINEKSSKEQMIDLYEDAKYVAKYKGYSLKDLLDEFLNEDKLKSIIAQYWGYFGLPPSKVSAIYYGYVWTEYFIYGGVYPHDRSQAISDKLVEIIKENGGEVFLKNKVKKIIIEDKKAVGVELNNGDVYYSNSVISNINLKDTFENMVGYENLNKRYVKKLEKVVPSLSNICVYIVLDIDFAEKYNEKSHELFINGEYDFEKAYDYVLEDQIEKAPLGITIYDNIIKGYNGEGKTTISIFQLSSYDNWKDMERDDYKLKKEKVLNCILDRLEKLFPEIKEHIIYSNVATPITNKRFTGNTNGAIYGEAMTIKQSLNGRLAQKTPIENLILAGAWTSPGAGYSGSVWSGYNAANIILRNDEKDD